MESSSYTSEFYKYRNNLTLVLFSYRHLVDNLVLDKPLLELLFQSRVLSLEDYNKFLKQVSNNCYEVVARKFVNLLLTKMRTRGECFRDSKSKRHLDQGLSQIDYFEAFMDVLRQCKPGVNFIPAYMASEITFDSIYVDKLFNEILPNSKRRDIRLREVVDWEAAACQLECQWVDFENSQDGEFIANCFINEAEALNASTDGASASNSTSSPASESSTRVDADSLVFSRDSEDHAAHSGRQLNGQANEAVTSDGPREALADATGYSRQPSSTTVLNETKDTKYKEMIHYMVEMGKQIDNLAPTALVNDYQLAINGITPELFKLPAEKAALKIEKLFSFAHPIQPNASPIETFLRLVKLLYFLYKCYCSAPPGISRPERVARVVHWFMLIMKNRLLSYLRAIDWSALWDSVSSTVAKVLDPSAGTGSARLQMLTSAIDREQADGAGASKKSPRDVAEVAFGVASLVVVALNPTSSLNWFLTSDL